jgi:hypothetical protein
MPRSSKCASKPRHRSRRTAPSSEESIAKSSSPLAHHARYEIKVKGSLDARWTAWFDSTSVTPLNGETIITGIVDQPKLRGILNKIWDLNLVLISVKQPKS